MNAPHARRGLPRSGSPVVRNTRGGTEAGQEPRLGGMTPRKRLSVALDCLLWLDENLPGLLPPDYPGLEHVRELRRELETLIPGA